MERRSLPPLLTTIRLIASLALMSCVSLAQAQASEKNAGIDLVGINMSGANFAPHITPGKVGTNYFYPEKKYFKYYADKDIRLIRFPFLWERLQHELYKGVNFDQIRLLRRTLDFAAEHNQKIILDMHNYGRYKGKLIGSPEVPYEAYASVWRKLAEEFKDHPALLGYDIMNEPHSTKGLWPAAAQAAVDAIRQVDMKTLIFVEGDRWASTFHWRMVNEDFLIEDPAEKIIYEGHLYLDKDFSGRYANDETVDPMLGVERARPFVEWLKENNLKGFLGEYGVPGNSESMLAAMDNLLGYLNENCMPSAYWAGGPGWGKYVLAVEPIDGKDRPQMPVLQKHISNNCTEFGPTPQQ
ncbi:glycoside hydrolase family 5 protein [Pseudomonas sp. SST3]|uniref:glycoside hydrolase family 5 protein n=1 Tax=Pseudomonas sp. SST3 TaxID=2267882 RepID=UPI000DFDFCA0|nr:glycoside hydrolase family 5 protein [Pseudomonas sp. SST3]